MRKAKKNYFGNLDETKVTDNKKFWKVVKPYFTDKGSLDEKITLVENDEVVDSEKVAEIFNHLFGTTVKDMNLPKPPVDEVLDQNEDSNRKFVSQYKNNPSVLKIKENRGDATAIFDFRKTTTEEIEKMILSLDAGKAQTKNKNLCENICYLPN